MTTEQPTQPGWHWFKYNDDELPECVLVYELDQELWFASLYCPAGRRCRSLSHAEWDGPLVNPFDAGDAICDETTMECAGCGFVGTVDAWAQMRNGGCPKCSVIPGDEN